MNDNGDRQWFGLDSSSFIGSIYTHGVTLICHYSWPYFNTSGNQVKLFAQALDTD